jgi:putative polyhydroxyalkanoic acid system protein
MGASHFLARCVEIVGWRPLSPRSGERDRARGNGAWKGPEWTGESLSGDRNLVATLRPNVSCFPGGADILSAMPKISLSVSHKLGQETARNRITGLIADSRDRFAGQVSQVSEIWNGYVDAISFQALGFSVTGKIDVQADQVLIELNLPLAAYPLKGRIEKEILTHARELLV